MKFARTDLIGCVKAEIARREAEADQAYTKALAQQEDRRRAYLDRTTDAWKRLADTVRARQRKGQAMTLADVPTELSGSRWQDGGRFDTFDSRDPGRPEVKRQQLDNLLVLLESTVDDEIPAASLERMGFRVASLFRE